jgi:GH25 family lysozyme M1 (1,4-beta-N-acetylmuramidase)
MAGFFDDQEREDKKEYKNTLVYFLAAVSFVMLLFLIVIYMNTKNKQERLRLQAAQEQVKQQQVEEQQLEEEALSVGESKLTSEDLDFWEMYEKDKDDTGRKNRENDRYDRDDRDNGDERDDGNDRNTGSSEDPDETVSSNGTGSRDDYRNRKGNEDPIADDKDAKEENSVSQNRVREKEDDGKHLKVQAKGEKATWYEIDEDIDGNGYDFKEYLSMDEDTLEYKDKNVSTVRGVDVSKYQGVVDWAKVKAAGYDFAMIRAGARGYGGGQLTLDDNFVLNMTGAKAAGLDVGVYFFTQATTKEEAVEEANFTVGALLNYGVTYPVAVDVEWIENDKARTDELTPEERTELALTFCETVKAFGYTPMIYATRNMLVAGMLPGKLTDYEVWLSDDYEPQDGTDYPYMFGMWQYSKTGKVDGITGDVDLNLRFINKKEK